MKRGGVYGGGLLVGVGIGLLTGEVAGWTLLGLAVGAAFHELIAAGLFAGVGFGFLTDHVASFTLIGLGAGLVADQLFGKKRFGFGRSGPSAGD